MTPKELKELILNGESTTLEFKRKISNNEKIAKELVAFANTKGGYLLIGVDDDGKIVGVESEKSTIDLIERICEFSISPPLTPQIEVVSVSGKDVIVVYICRSDVKPHIVIHEEDEQDSPNNAYIRVGEKSLIASREMKRLLAEQNTSSKPLLITIGKNEKRLFAYLEKYERISVKVFAKLVNISRRRAERLLINLVRAGVLQINVDNECDYFTLVEDPYSQNDNLL